MKRKVGYCGKIMSTTGFIYIYINYHFFDINATVLLLNVGTKPTFIKKIKDVDISFATTIFKVLSPINERFVKNNLRVNNNSAADRENEVVSNIDNIAVTKQSIQCLNIGKPLTKILMKIALQFFRKHSLRICNSHHETNGGQHRYEPYKSSVFCSPDFFDHLKQDPNTTVLPQHLENLDWNAAYRIYFPILNSNESDEWYLLVADITEKKFTMLIHDTI
jgi:hypothetical protein